MSILNELRVRARHVVGPVLGLCAVGYVAFHMVHGERGLVAWWEIRTEIAEARIAAEAVSFHRAAWEAKVKGLSPGGLDPDLLDERARLMLGLGRPDEVVIFLNQD